MRRQRPLALVLGIAPLIIHVAGCDDKKQDELVAKVAGSASAAVAATTPAADAAPASSGSATAAASDAGDHEGGAGKPLTMPERPIPKGQTTVGAGMPIEVQQKAIAYMVAMRAPRPEDPNADPAYANELATKLRPVVMAMDTGPNKATMNRVEVVANGRQLDLLMSGGCDDKAPFRAVQTRAGVPLATLASRGVLVVRCNDARIQCLQSTRDPDDVLCTTAPRHK